MKRLILIAILLLPALARAADRPNLLFLSIDTLRSDHLSCYGYDRPTTPTLDQIAANGTRFDQARSTAPWTLPSFATMFTGRYPTRHGAGAEGLGYVDGFSVADLILRANRYQCFRNHPERAKPILCLTLRYLLIRYSLI